MPAFCDVALPVPLESTFTYRVNGSEPVVGGRVLVPFRSERLAGVVVALHDNEPKIATKQVIAVLDSAPVISSELMKLAEWIAGYYLAPLGEVLRTMLPLGAEVPKAIGYRITDLGREALHKAAERGAGKARKSEAEQEREFSVLNHLLDRDLVKEAALRSASGASRATLQNLARKKWIAREDVTAARDASRTVRFAVLKEIAGKLNDNQRQIVEVLAASGGSLAVERIHDLDVPRSTLATLARRGVVAIEERPAEFAVSGMPPSQALRHPLNPRQQRALEAINSAMEARKFSVALLHGVTGSGKTAVYLSAMQQVLAAGRSALLLVPEIGLTPAAAAHLHGLFGGDVAILHSALTPAERAEQWHRIRRGEARIVVGTRSAVFAPVADVALIVVDEEHDASYKQEETPRYHGRDVAVMRGKLASAAVVLASATPALESYFNAGGGKYALLELPDRVQERPLPQVEVVDMREEFRATGEDQLLSRRLLEEIKACLERREQAMLLLNRRGYSPVVLCRACGETVQCQNCAIALTHHRRRDRLLCHYCGYQRPVPKVCPKCGSEYLFFLGTGSEKLEEKLHELFPQARIARLDRDTVRDRGDYERALAALHAGELDILVGTQMIAKGHDIHGVTLVGVVAADFGLSFPDFRAAERTFQLLTQVAGRAGRGDAAGLVVLQTYYPEHYAIQFAARHDYHGFYDKELRYRSWMRYPPYSSVANVLVRSEELQKALNYSGLLGRWFEKTKLPGIRVLGPAAAPIVRLKRDFRYHFVLKGESRTRLNAALRAMLAHAAEQKIPRTNVIVDVDALSLL